MFSGALSGGGFARGALMVATRQQVARSNNCQHKEGNPSQ
jgi:hypothetical protein